MKKLFALFLSIPVIVSAQTRMPFVQFFTNVSCTNCPAMRQALDQAMATVGRSNIAVVSYENSITNPSDPIYLDNASESDARTSYYNVIADPTLYVDSTIVPQSNSTIIQAGLQQHMQQTAPLAITLSGTRNGRSGNVNVSVSGSAPGNWKLFAVITESGLIYHGTNGEANHDDVFRTTLTTWSGIDATSGHVQLPFHLGTGHGISTSDTSSQPWDMNNCRIVVWAQSTSSKAIYQAAQIWVDSLTPQSNSTFTFTTGDTVLASAISNSAAVAAGYVKNITGDSINVLAYRITNNIPFGWQTEMCMTQCYAGTVDTASVQKLAPGDSQLFLLHFLPAGLPASGTVTVSFTDMNDTTSRIIKQFLFKTNAGTNFTTPAPTGLPSIAANQQDTIAWNTDLTGTAELDFSVNSGESWIPINTSVDLTAKVYLWTPATDTAIYNVQLRLQTSEGNIISYPFTITAPTAVSEPLPQSYALSCAPNPANSLVNISLQGYPVQRVAIYDGLGRSVYDHSFSHPAVGMTIPVNTSALLPGVYFARVSTPSQVFNSQIVVVH